MNLLSPMAAKPLGNPMLPSTPASSASPHDQLLASMTAQHATARAKLDKIDEAAAKQKAIREQLDHLMTLGDLVDERDLVRSASKIVAAGIEPMAIASLLADAPTGGEALQSWVAGQEQQFRQREAQLGAIQGMARHETGLAALRLLAAHSFAPRPAGLQAPDSQTAQAMPMANNPLMQPGAGAPAGDAAAAPASNDLLEPSPRADGGPVDAGSPYLVGEKGPELLVPNRPGTIVPNQRLPFAGGDPSNPPQYSADPQTRALQLQLEAEIIKAGGINELLKKIQETQKLPRM